MFDEYLAAALLAIVVVIRIAYAARRATIGARRFARVDAAGTSPLLGKPTMEATYWVLAPLARSLSKNGVSANGVTGCSIVLGILAGISLGTGHFGLGGAFAAMSALCDALDGFVARETRSQSEAGELFDASADRYNEFFFLAGVAFFYRGSIPILALSFFALHGSFMVSYASAKAESLHLSPPRGWMRRPERTTYLTAGATLSAVFATTGGPLDPNAGSLPILLALGLVAIGANVSAVHRLVRTAQLATLRSHENHAAEAKPPLTPDTESSPVRAIG